MLIDIVDIEAWVHVSIVILVPEYKHIHMSSGDESRSVRRVEAAARSPGKRFLLDLATNV